MNGSLYSSGPQFLLDKNILLVGVNSRLDCLGYMSTNDAECPGNFGLKDQYSALEWVHDNINAFGGDPSKVTLFGQNTGAVNAQLHSWASSGTKQLFNRLILDNAVATFTGVFNENPKYSNRSKKLAKALNCTTSNSKAMIDCLRSVDAKEFVRQYGLFGDVQKNFAATWTPCNEPKVKGAYFTKTLDEAIAESLMDVPTMYGYSAQAGLYVTKCTNVNLVNFVVKKKKLFDSFKCRLILSFADGYASDDYYKLYWTDTVCVKLVENYYPHLVNVSREQILKMCVEVKQWYNDGPIPEDEKKSKV